MNDIEPWFAYRNPDGSPESIEWFNLLIHSIEEVKKLRAEATTLTQQNQDILQRLIELENK